MPLPSLPGTFNPFWVSLAGSKARFNPFEEQVRELPFNNDRGLGEAERLLQVEVRNLTSRNIFLAMKVDELKQQLESVGCVSKRLCRGSF